MVILHVSTRLILGGSQKVVVEICAGQVARGHEVWLAFGPIYGPEGSLLHSAEQTGAALVEVGSMRRAILPFHDYWCYLQLRRLIRKIRPDVVHTHSSKAGILGRAAAWKEKVPAVIHTIHGLPFNKRQHTVIHKIYVFAERWAANRCHRIVAVTRAMRDSFQEESIGHPDQFVHIYNGLDLKQLTPEGHERTSVRRKLHISMDSPVVGMVARFDPLKGHKDLLEIVPGLIEMFPDLKLILVGDGWYRAEAERQVEDYGLSGTVVFTGLVGPQRVRVFLAAVDVLVLPSYQEGLGLVLIEGLLAGCGIVAYDVGGIGEVCIDNVTGLLVAPGDRVGLLSAVTCLLNDPDKRKVLTENGLEHANRNFSLEGMLESLEALYCQVINR